MRNWVIALTLIALCTPAHAALVNNPESFEVDDIACPWWPCWDYWESWGSGSGASGWVGWNDRAELVCGDGTDGDCCLQASVSTSVSWGYTTVFNHGTPIVPGGMYTYFFDYKYFSGGGVIKLEFYDADNNQLSVTAWDPYPVTLPGVWQHFSYTFTAPVDAEFVTVVVGTTGVGSIMWYDMVGLLPVYTDCWGLATCSENPYTFSNPGDLYGMDGWTTFGQGPGTAVVSDGVCTLTTDSVKLAHNHDNELAAIGNPVPGVDNVEMIIKVLSITGDPIVKIESFGAANSFPNNDWDAALRTDTWDPATKITGPGVYSFSTAEKGGPIPVDTAAITPTFGVSGSSAELVVDWIWIGKEGTFPYDPCPYEIAGDEDGDCMVTLNDLALMLGNWLVDCIDDPTDPACVTP